MTIDHQWLGQQALMQGHYQSQTAEQQLQMRLVVLENHINRMDEYRAEADRIRKALAVLKGE